MLHDTARIRSRLDLLHLVACEFNAGLDINQVLHRVLSVTVASVGAYDASLLLFDAEGQPENLFLVSDFEVRQLDRLMITTPKKQGLVNWVKNHRTGVLINDTHTDQRWLVDENNLKLRQAGSAVTVPIQLPEQFIGVLTITATQPDYFDQSDLAMLSIIADQAAFAIANARLFETEQHRRRVADTLASVARTVNSTLDLDEVLNLILQQLALVINYDSSAIFLYEDNMLVVRAARGFDDLAEALRVTLLPDENVPNYQAVLQKKPTLIVDVDREPGWIKTSSSRKVRSWIGAPLIARDKVIGMLTIDSYEVNKYNAENVNVVAAFASQAATAVANAQVVTLLRNLEDSYTDLFENSTDLILITDYQGLILNANRKACQMLRRPKEALIGGDIMLIDRRLHECLMEQTKRLQAWREVSLELDIVDAYRQTVYLEIKVRHVQYEGKDGVQWVGRDISSRKESEQVRQDLINMLVHDLRGPIGNLINTIELLQMLASSITGDSRVSKILDMARRSGQEVRDLVDSMLDMGSLETGEVFLQRNPIALEEVIDAVQDRIIPRAAHKEMELSFSPLPEAPELWIDGGMIRRVLTNLLDNAIKYTPSQGKISLTTTLLEDKVRFAVSDNGPGISKANQALIFNKFSRVDHSQNAPSGAGLGLAFCKLAAEAHGGAISVESEGIPGRGSTFYLTLPLISPPDEE